MCLVDFREEQGGFHVAGHHGKRLLLPELAFVQCPTAAASRAEQAR